MIIAGWIAVALEALLLLIWIYSIFFVPNGTDPAGKGTAMVFVLALGVYIGVGAVLMLLKKNWSVILTLIMAAIPLGIVIIGLVKKYGSASTRY